MASHKQLIRECKTALCRKQKKARKAVGKRKHEETQHRLSEQDADDDDNLVDNIGDYPGERMRIYGPFSS